MTQSTVASPTLQFLDDRWDANVAAKLDEPELLRYRSNLLGSDLRITNFAGGNTSSKVREIDPLTGESVEVLWVKGSGGDLGSMKRAGFATLYQEKLLALERSYKGVDHEDDMVAMYPLCTFRNNPVAASIDTPLHGFLPFPHVDHLHPDWGIALAASANGKVKMEEFNREFSHSLVWIPWQRPGFELGIMMRRAVAAESRLRRHRSRRPRPLHLGPDAARVLSQHDHAHRPDRPVHSTPRQAQSRRFGGEAVPARSDRDDLAIAHCALSPRPRQHAESLDREFHGRARRPAVREFAYGQGACVSRNQLPRPLHSHQDSSAVCSLGRRRRHRRAEEADRLIARRISRAIPRLLSPVRHARFARFARSQSRPSCSFPASACSASARTRPKPASPASSIPMPFT